MVQELKRKQILSAGFIRRSTVELHEPVPLCIVSLVTKYNSEGNPELRSCWEWVYSAKVWKRKPIFFRPDGPRWSPVFEFH